MSGATDSVIISRPTTGTLRVTDFPSGPYAGSGIHVGTGCTRTGDYGANCSATGITLIQASTGNDNDALLNSTGIKSSLNGGPQDDEVTGGAADDTLTPGPGVDTVRGMNGNDQIFARDFVSDALINCDGGTTPGHADKADLDFLPADPNTVVIGCETKTRH